MKPTSKIIIAALLAGWLLIIGVNAFFYLFSEKRSADIICSEKRIEKPIPHFHTVKADLTSLSLYKEKRAKSLYTKGLLRTIREEATASPRISFSEEIAELLSYEVKSDTLFLSWKREGLEAFPKHERLIMIENIAITVHTPDSLQRFSAKAGTSFLSKVENFVQDSLHITDCNQTLLQAASIRSVNVDHVRHLTLQASTVENLYMDLDGVNRWEVNECQLQHEWLTGSRNHNNTLQPGECKQLHWKPKTEDATLHVGISEAATLTME